MDEVVHVWNLSSKSLTILQQTCAFLSSHQDVGDRKHIEAAGEEIGHVCFNVRI